MKRNNISACFCDIYKNFLDFFDIFDCADTNNLRIIKGKIKMDVEEKVTLQHSSNINELNLSNYPQLIVNCPL